jgi:hypothetical protein
MKELAQVMAIFVIAIAAGLLMAYITYAPIDECMDDGHSFIYCERLFGR